MRRIKTYAAACSILLLAGLTAVTAASMAPGDFPRGSTATIDEGMTISGAASLLKEKGIIRSEASFKAYAAILGDETGIKSGKYLFEDPQSSLRLAHRLVEGQRGFEQIKVTVPEGLASQDIARLLKREMPTFNDRTFASLAKAEEGYLFPDTYFFDAGVAPEEAIAAMKGNFDRATVGLSLPRSLPTRSFKDVVIMASLIEEEATSTEDRRIISGILWKRLEDGMPLQVDAPFFYILGKTSSQLTRSDLAMDSPYNLYTNSGLPPAPIDNPSLDSIRAALNPIETDYWFFLSGRDGRTHYAETHDGHVENKDRYLN